MKNQINYTKREYLVSTYVLISLLEKIVTKLKKLVSVGKWQK